MPISRTCAAHAPLTVGLAPKAHEGAVVKSELVAMWKLKTTAMRAKLGNDERVVAAQLDALAAAPVPPSRAQPARTAKVIEQVRAMVWRTAEPSLASELREEQRGAFVTTLRRLVAMHEAQEGWVPLSRLPLELDELASVDAGARPGELVLTTRAAGTLRVRQLRDRDGVAERLAAALVRRAAAREAPRGARREGGRRRHPDRKESER